MSIHRAAAVMALASIGMAAATPIREERIEPIEPRPKKKAKPIVTNTVTPPQPEIESRQVRRARERAYNKRVRERNYQAGERRYE